jgi:hypothetical protein
MAEKFAVREIQRSRRDAGVTGWRFARYVVCDICGDLLRRIDLMRVDDRAESLRQRARHAVPLLRIEIVVGGVGEIGKVAVGDAVKFFADDVGGEAGAEEGAVEGGEFFLVDGAAKVGEAALEAGADESGFVGVGEDGGEGGVDVNVGDAATAEFTSDAETSLAAGLGVVAGVFEGVTGVVEVVEFAETGDHWRDEVFSFGAALEIFFHFMDGESAAHEGALSGHVELVFGAEFANGGAEGHDEI